MFTVEPRPLQRRSFDPDRFSGTREPLLCELLDDPATQRVMARDGSVRLAQAQAGSGRQVSGGDCQYPLKPSARQAWRVRVRSR